MKVHNMAEIVVVTVLSVVACGIAHIKAPMYANETAREQVIEANMQKHVRRADFIQAQNPRAYSVAEEAE
jgi:Tfp pilus assembly major pilin PilA